MSTKTLLSLQMKHSKLIADFKLAYIEAFNRMEAQLQEQAQATLARTRCQQEVSSMKTLLSVEAARGLHVKHSKLMRDLDRVRSILTPAKADGMMLPTTYTDAKGQIKRAYTLTQACAPFLLAGEASKSQITWLAEVWG